MIQGKISYPINHFLTVTFSTHYNEISLKYLWISKEIWYSYRDFLDRGLVITKKLVNQEFQVMLKSSLRKYYERRNDLVVTTTPPAFLPTKLTYQISLFTGYLLTRVAPRRMLHVDHDLPTLKKHMRPTLVFDGVRVSQFLCCVCILLFVFWYFSYFAMALSVFFRLVLVSYLSFAAFGYTKYCLFDIVPIIQGI